MRFQFHSAAEDELDQAVEYYERCQSGLGLEFAEEVYATIARIIEYPEVWSQMSRNTRRCLTNRFPYGIIYRIKNNNLHIIAVANLHRRPDFWKERVVSGHLKEISKQ
jgi:plasmid stabilization system protein ParE